MLSIIGKGIHNILGEGKNGYKMVFPVKENNYIHIQRQRNREREMDTCIYKHIDINIYGSQVTFLYTHLPFKFSKHRNCFVIRKKFFKEGIIFPILPTNIF